MCFCLCVCFGTKQSKTFALTSLKKECGFHGKPHINWPNYAISCSESILGRGQTDKCMPVCPLPKNQSSKSVKSHALVIKIGIAHSIPIPLLMNPNPIPTQIYTIPTPNPIPLHINPNPESNPDSDSDSSFDSDSGFGIAPGLVPGWSKVHDGDVEGVELNKRAVEHHLRPLF